MSNINNKAEITCAIYTSGLPNASLDEMHDAYQKEYQSCMTYIKSQAHKGLVFAENYMDIYINEALKERAYLFYDIHLGKIKCVVIYKIESLSRSLQTFIKLNKLFEEYGVSLIIVSQKINTSNFIGRLMLKLFLSLELVTSKVLKVLHKVVIHTKSIIYLIRRI